MIKGISEYWGTELSCALSDSKGMLDMHTIARILKENDIKIGGYDADREPAKIEYSDNCATLYLGR